jgi:hypothetical protein
MRENYVTSSWILCVGALVRLERCPDVDFGLESVICNTAYDLKMVKHGRNMSSLSTQ